MPDCTAVKNLATPYVDGELQPADREVVEQHLSECRACRTAVATEKAVRALLTARRESLHRDCAPANLRARCAASVTAVQGAEQPRAAARVPSQRWGTRLAPLAAAAALLLVVGGAFLYQATAGSSRLIAAQLTADHVKCFTMNAALGTHQSPETVQGSMASGFGWTMRVPDDSAGEGLELVGSRPCLSAEGKVAHIMYRHKGHPVSLFMLPNSGRPAQTVEVLGHRCAIWSGDNRTFVLVSREPLGEVEHLAAVVQAALK